MSSIINDLRGVTARPLTVQTGTVIEISSTSIIVRSPVGRREFRVPSPAAYSVGSTVRFQGELLIGLSPGREGLPTFSV